MMGVSMPKRTASSSKKGHQPDSYGSLTGTGSRPKAVGSPVVKPTSMGGTLEVTLGNLGWGLRGVLPCVSLHGGG